MEFCTQHPHRGFPLSPAQRKKEEQLLIPSALQSIDPPRPFCQRRDPEPMPQPFLGHVNIVIADSSVTCHPIIPECDRPLLPLDPHLKVLAKRDVVEKKLQQRLALLILQPHNPLGKTRVDKKCLLACGRVNPNDRVLGFHWFAAHKQAVTAGAFCLGKAGVLSAEVFKKRLDGRGKTGIGGSLGLPCGVASCRGHREQSQDGDPGGLALVGNVRVIAGRGETVASAAVPVFVVATQIYVMQFLRFFDVGTDGLRGKGLESSRQGREG